MSTRHLIMLAMGTGMAILIAFAVQMALVL